MMLLLALPPALGEQMCVSLTEQMGSMQCCGASVQAAVSAVAQSCGEMCCSVAPGESQRSAIPDRMTLDSAGADASPAASTAISTPEATPASISANIRALDLPVLLHTFRI